HGAMLFSGAGVFVMPAYPTETVVDPTGAGDSFAGGILGYLASDASQPPGRLRRAMAYGTVVASFPVAGFGLDRLRRTERSELAGCFPNPRRPRVLWIGVGAGTQELCALHDDLEPPLLDLGCYRREDRKYSPHITLGRVRSDRPADQLGIALDKQASWQGGQIDVGEIHGMSSELTPKGRI